MIRRLYSIDREIPGHMLDVVENGNQKTGRQELIDEMDKRKNWKYSWRERCCAPKGSSCCRCLCCKPTTRKDRLFDKGRKKLMDEIDLLNIVK